MKTRIRQLIGFVVAVALCLTMLLPAAAVVSVQTELGIDITYYGTPIVCCNQVQNGANPDLNVIVDGVTPDENGLLSQYYGTFGSSTPHDGQEYFGVEFDGVCDFTGFVYQTGMHWHDGGWFVGDSIGLQVRQDDVWVDVDQSEYTVSPSLPRNTVLEDNEDNFTLYTFAFHSSIQGTAIRIVGLPGGSMSHVGCAEVAVYAEREPVVVLTDYDITSHGSPIACCTNPINAANTDIGVIVDGVMPGADGGLGDYFATSGETEHDGDCYFGVEFKENHELTRFVYQTGIHWPDGGWFVGDTIRLQVKQEDTWVDIDAAAYTVTPALPQNTATENLEANFAAYTFEFNTPIQGTAVRIIGTPGGSLAHTSCAEVAVYAEREPVVVLTDYDITSHGTPIACCTNPINAANTDIGVIVDGVMPGADGGLGDYFATSGETEHDGDCYFGVEFKENHELTRFVYQTGIHWPDGGWFVGDTIRLQVKQEDTWVDVSAEDYTVTPALPQNTATENLEANFAAYTFEFNTPIQGTAVRIIGTPGGSLAHTSCAEVAVYAVAMPSTEGLPQNITSNGTPIACCTNPINAANTDIGVIVDGVMPGADGGLGDYFATSGETEHDGDCYFGVEFEENHELTRFVYQTGMHWGDGGWFIGDTVRLQVKQDGAWVDIDAAAYTVTPALAQNTATENLEANFTAYTFEFNTPIQGTAVRIIGTPGGSSAHTSCAEVAVYAQPKQLVVDEDALTHDGLFDRIKGARFAEGLGYAWGHSVSGHHNNTMMADGLVPNAPRSINSMYSAEDIYGEIPFLKAYLENPDCTLDEIAQQLLSSEATYTHSTRQALENLKAGVEAGASGDSVHNQHYNDYNWAALANLFGMMYPGDVNKATAEAFEAGHVTADADGAYAGAFMAAMQSAAFVSEDVRSIVDQAIEAIPAESDFGAMIREIRWCCTDTAEIRDVYELLQLGWYDYESCPDSPGEAKTTVFTNAAFVMMALLFGNGDFDTTAQMAVGLGQLSDSTASTALSILGAMKGYEGIDARYKKVLAVGSDHYVGSDWDFDALIENTFDFAERHLTAVGAVYDEVSGWQIDAEEICTLALEESPTLPVLTLSGFVTEDREISLKADAFALTFTRVTYTWDFGDGTTGEGASPVHQYSDYGIYTVACTATDKEGNARTETMQMSVFPLLDDFKELITTATAPQGLGNKDLAILHDGVFANADENELGPADQYDSFGTAPDENGYTWFGYTYELQHNFQTLIFQEGVHDNTGGFIPNGTMKVQVLTDAGWVDVSGMTVSPNYPVSANYRDFGDGFEIFTVSFDPIDGYGIRLMGSGCHFGLAELIACGVLNMTDEEKLAAVNEKLANLPNAESVTAGNVKTVTEIRAMYDELPEEIQGQVENYDRLTAVEAKIAERTQQAGVVDEQILALPGLDDMTAEDKEAVEAVRTAYDALDDLVKTFVNHLEALEKAEKKIADLTITYGDINEDDRIDAADALKALQHAVQLIELEGDHFAAADVDVNDKVDASDALLILQYTVKLIDTLPKTN